MSQQNNDSLDPTLPANHSAALPGLLITAAAFAVALTAWPALDGPLVLDSVKLHDLEHLIREHGSGAIWHTPGFGDSLWGLNRIVAMASFVANLQIDGGVSAFSLKLTNLGIHLATGALVFTLTRLLVATTAHAAQAPLIAAATAALWLLSPVNLNVAAYAVQRMAQLSALFSLAGLCLYTAGRLSEPVARRRLYLALAGLVCLPLAVLSKQNGALLIPLAFLVEVYFLQPARPTLTRRQLALIAVSGTAAGLALLLYLHPGILGYQLRDFTLAERLLSQPRALASYLRHILLPLGNDVGVYSDDFTASQSLLAPPATLAALAAVAALAWLCVRLRASRRFGLAAFGVAFFGVGHALESTFIPLELYFLHRNYLPDVGIYFAVAGTAIAGLPGRRPLVLVLLAIYAVYFATVGHGRALTWSSQAQITAAAVHHHPRSPRALSDYAQTMLDQGEAGRALAAIDRTIALNDTAGHRVQRLYILCRAGAAIPEATYAGLEGTARFGVRNELGQAQANLLGLYRGDGCDRLRVQRLVAALDTLAARYGDAGGDPWTFGYYAAAFLDAAGNRDAALARLKQSLDAGHLESGLYRLELLLAAGRRQAAARTLSEITTQFDAERLDPYKQTLEEFRQRL